MLLQSAILAVGAWLVINQQSTPGIIIAGSILGARALAPIDLAIANWRGFVAARQSWQRLSRLLGHLPPQNEPMPLKPPSHTLVVQNGTIAPPGQQKIVCQDINFTLAAGKALGVIGPTASGKSSLARMLVGVWAPVRGTVRLDGATLDQWSPESARPVHRLRAAGRRIVQRHRGAEYFAVRRTAGSGRGDRRSARGRRARSHHQSFPTAMRRPSATMAARFRQGRRSALRLRARFIAIRSWSCSTSPIPISMPKATKR